MEMIRVLPKGCCPKCGHRQFIVKEISSNLYLTGRNGEIIDSKEEKYIAVGKCLNCGKEYEMAPSYDSFIPLTPIRKVLFDYELEEIEKDNPNNNLESIPNPFERS